MEVLSHQSEPEKEVTFMLHTTENVIRHKIGLLNLAEELDNVSKACKIMGVSRDTFYRYKEAVEDGGVEALIEQSRRKPNPKNRIDRKVEQAVVDYGVEQPAHGQVRASNELRKRGIFVSPTGGSRRLAQARPGDFQEAPEGPGSQSGGRGLGLYRGPDRGPGKAPAGPRGLRRNRDPSSGLSRLAGHLLHRHAERRRPDLPADLRRHLRQGGLCQAVHDENADHVS